MHELNLRCSSLRALVFFACLIGSMPSGRAAQNSAVIPHQKYVPPELQVSDLDTKRLLESAAKSATLGRYLECPPLFERAIERATKQGAFADRGIVEDNLAVYYFTQGKLEDAKSQWVNALSDGVTSSQLVLQADVLVALSGLEQAGGHLNQAMQLMNEAVVVARKSKSLYILSRALGELSRLQLGVAKQVDARASVEEALQLDEINHYDWKASHLLGLAWVNAAESKVSRAMEFAVSARDLAISDENYVVFMQTSLFLGQVYVHTGQPEKGIRTLEFAQKGLSEENKPLFRAPDLYARAVSLPYLKVTFLEALSLAYEAGNRLDDAISNWRDLYNAAASANFVLAKAEGARHLADLYKAKKELNQSIDYYSLAAEAFASGGNEQERIQALASEAGLLVQQGRKDKALAIDEQLLPLTKASDDVRLHIIVDLAIAEILDGAGEVERVYGVLTDAETLVGPDFTVPTLEPIYLVELYFRVANIEEKRKNLAGELVALEKALTPALALANAPKETKNDKPLFWLVPQLEAKLPSYHIRETGETAYESKNFTDALVSFELLQYFEEFDAAWKGHREDYTKNIYSDPTLTRLLEIPAKVIAQDGGPVKLAMNLESMGLLAGRIKPSGFGLLTNYYISQKRPDVAVTYARKALSSFSLFENHTPNQWSVAMTCEFAYALAMDKDVESATDAASVCVKDAEKLGIPTLLLLAHQTKIWVVDAAGRHDEAEESIQYLLKNKPDDPLEYSQLAQLRAQQGNRIAAADAWTTAIRIYERGADLNGSASAHLALGNLLILGTGAEAEHGLMELATADEQYRKLGSIDGRIKAEASLGAYYAAQKNDAQSRRYFESALKIARVGKSNSLEATVLSQIGQAYETSANLARAIEYYRRSFDIYQLQKNSSDEALQLKNVANVLSTLHEPEEAMATILRAKALADESGSWFARYWIQRTLSEISVNKGDYQSGLTALRDAQQISSTANQPLFSAWAALASAPDLEAVGSWQDASDQINSALPVLVRFNETDGESSAYMELMAIYGARESDLRDLTQALSFYQQAYRIIVKSHPDRAAALDLDLTEIYWNQGRSKDAIAKANEALAFFKTVKDDLGEANALISLAEAQRSDGELTLAADSLRLAGPLVNRVQNFYTFGRFHYVSAGLYRAQGRLGEAIDEYERVVGMLEQFKSSSGSESQTHFADNYDFIYDELVETYYALAQSDPARAESAANKALEYAELNKSQVFAKLWGRAFVDELRRQVPAALQAREERIANDREVVKSESQQAMMKMGKISTKQIEERRARLRDDESELKKDIWKTSAAYAEVRYPQRMSIGEIPLRPGELLVQLKVLDQATLVWLVTGTTQGARLAAFYEVHQPRQWFADRVLRIRDVFNAGHPERFDSKVTDELLGALFPAPAVQSLENAKVIIFVPDDVLFLLPFEMLSSRGRFLLISKSTEYFPSAASFRLSRTSIHQSGAWQRSLLGIADPITSSDDPRYLALGLRSNADPKTVLEQSASSASLDKLVSRGFSLERLPGTADEVRGIATLFPSTPTQAELRMGVDATKEELLRTDLSRYRFIHFATHGLLPVESGIKEPALILSLEGKGKDDMLLTLSQILELKLRAEMVVLSACNTGSGKVTRAEGVASLGSAFLAAGASSVTVSLWQVADSSTAMLMQEFYKNLVGGKSKSAALAAARQSLVDKGYDNPFFWAPFVLTGE